MKPEKHDFWVTLRDSEAEKWTRILGPDLGKRLPVRGPYCILGNLPGFEVPQRVFLLAVDVLESSDVQKIAAELAARFGLTPEESEREVREHGIPIREEHTNGVIIHNPQKWF